MPEGEGGAKRRDDAESTPRVPDESERTDGQSIYVDRPQDRPGGMVTGRWRGRRWKPDGTDVFCGDRSFRPETLFETKHFYVVPDLYPLTPGHILIIPKAHYPCFGAVPARWEREFEGIVTRVRAFLRDTQGRGAMAWENGGPAAGQSVHHAHWHLIPMPPALKQLPPPVEAQQIRPGLADVRAWWLSHHGGRPYHVMELGSDRRLLPTGSADLRDANNLKAQVLGVTVGSDGWRWVRRQNPVWVARTVVAWRKWERANPEQPRRGPEPPARGVA